ncbi:hypothetical protein [Paenibacillus sp. B2(2019)]|nr:hypothetical protein [Paenibacillus sp. B2(2019)]
MQRNLWVALFVCSFLIWSTPRTDCYNVTNERIRGKVRFYHAVGIK